MTTTQQHYTIPARNAGNCIKALYLAATGVSPSDPPDETARLRMQAGIALKDVVVEALRSKGWETRHAAPAFPITFDHTLQVMSRPDEYARHSEISDGRWILVQTASAKDGSFKRWLKETSINTYPHLVNQLAILTTHQESLPEPPEDLDTSQAQLVAMLNRDTGTLEYEFLEPRELNRAARAIASNLQLLSQALQTGDQPEAPFKRTARQCQQCEFLTMCHGKAKRKSGDKVSQEHLDAAIAIIEDLHEEVLAAKPAANRYDNQKKIIRQYMIENDITDLELPGETRVWIAHLERDAQTRINADAARQHLSTSLMAEISTTSHVMSFSPK